MQDRYEAYLRSIHPDWDHQLISDNVVVIDYIDGIRDLMNLLDERLPGWFER